MIRPPLFPTRTFPPFMPAGAALLWIVWLAASASKSTVLWGIAPALPALVVAIVASSRTAHRSIRAWRAGVLARRCLRRRLTRAGRELARCRELERLRTEWDAVIAHDLRQPLSTINTSAEVMRQIGALMNPGSEVERRAVDRIVVSTGRMARMIDDLLDASRLEARRLELRPRELDLQSFLPGLAEELADVTGDHLLRLELLPPVPRVFADPDRLEQIVGNLLSNAAKYGRPGSAILLRARACAGGVSISVTNEGKGIAPEEVSRLFSRFHRTRGAREGGARGIGLGLYIVRGLVEAHGGTISVRSIQDEQTTFEIVLPGAAARPEPPAIARSCDA